MGKISVGPPYFDTVFVPLLTPLVFLMGIGPLARWKDAELPDLAVRLRWAAGTAVVATIVAVWAHGGVGIVGAIGFGMAFWIIASVATDLTERLRAPTGTRTSVLRRAALVPRAMVGMMIAHLGVAAFILGVTLVRSGEVERDVRMNIGDTTQIGDYVFTFRGVRELPGPNYRAAEGTIDVTVDGRPVVTLHPQKRVYSATQSVMTEAAIDPGLTRDLYVSLGEPVVDKSGGGWIVADLLQAVRRLDLGRLPDHGDRRPARGDRPPLSAAREADPCRARRRRRRAAAPRRRRVKNP